MVRHFLHRDALTGASFFPGEPYRQLIHLNPNKSGHPAVNWRCTVSLKQILLRIAVAGRGFSSHIATEFDVPLPDSACVYCGNCIGVCPTGALMFKSEYDMRQAGTWDETRQTRTETICPYCGVGCELTVHAQDGEIVRVTSPTNHSVTHGNLCITGRFGWQFVEIQKAPNGKPDDRATARS